MQHINHAIYHAWRNATHQPVMLHECQHKEFMTSVFVNRRTSSESNSVYVCGCACACMHVCVGGGVVGSKQ